MRQLVGRRLRGKIIFLLCKIVTRKSCKNAKGIINFINKTVDIYEIKRNVPLFSNRTLHVIILVLGIDVYVFVFVFLLLCHKQCPLMELS